MSKVYYLNGNEFQLSYIECPTNPPVVPIVKLAYDLGVKSTIFYTTIRGSFFDDVRFVKSLYIWMKQTKIIKRIPHVIKNLDIPRKLTGIIYLSDLLSKWAILENIIKIYKDTDEESDEIYIQMPPKKIMDSNENDKQIDLRNMIEYYMDRETIDMAVAKFLNDPEVLEIAKNDIMMSLPPIENVIESNLNAFKLELDKEYNNLMMKNEDPISWSEWPSTENDVKKMAIQKIITEKTEKKRRVNIPLK